jgi:uncharacterized membrane protein YciS (DUF1049 family)
LTTINRLALLAFVLWEAWWAYEYVAAPRPDYEMRSVAAILFGLCLPVALGIVVGLALLVRLAIRRAQARL